MKDRPARLGALPLAALFATGTAAVMVSGLKPLLVTLYITRFGFSTAHTGLVVAAEMCAAAIATTAVATLLIRLPMRRLALGGLVLLLASDLASLLPLGLAGFAGVRVLAGLGEGTAAATMAATIAGLHGPDRLMGASNSLALVVLAAAFAAIPSLESAFGVRSVFAGLAATTLPALVLTAWFPHAMTRSSAPGAGAPPSAGLRHADAALALFGTAAFYLALGGIWPFAGEIGRAAGLQSGQISEVLGLAQLTGAAGSILPVLLGRTVGRSLPLCASMAGCLVALLGLDFAGGAAFAWAIPVFLGCAMVVFAYLMGVIAGIDPSGRISSLSLSIQTVGLGIGPAWGGLLAARAGPAAILHVGIACMPLSLCALLPLALRQDR
jgi:predicted MFS family arabinose efflux permease